MKFYLAGKYDDRFQLNKYINELIQQGHKVTHNWAVVDQTIESRPIQAMKDIQGVIDADCIICIMTDPEYAYRGTFAELGAALALKKRVIIVNPNPEAFCTTNIFYDHPGIKYVPAWRHVPMLLV